jgi:hypothetical protein
MIIGDVVERKEVLGFKGILLQQMYMLPDTLDETQLSLYPREQWSYWKVLWFKHPFERVPTIDSVLGKDIVKIQKKVKASNGL